MLKSFTEFFRGSDWSESIIKTFDSMLQLAEENFRLCADRLVEHADLSKIQDELYARDREINAMERDIRRRIISHLAASPSVHEIPTAFILSSLVKDAERLGDYVKNLYEVHHLHGDASFDRRLYDPYYDGIRTAVKRLFGQVRHAFCNSDEAAARQAIEEAREMMRRCEKAIRDIATANHTVPEAVSLVLVGRHYKRILAHLVNIATAVVMPADQLDYYDEPEKPAK